MKFGTAILCNVTKKMVEKKFQNCSYRDDDVTNYVNFSKINLVATRKKDFQDLFSAFERQDNIQIEYI